jgi:hypothetical protein
MAVNFAWRCPFCGNNATITDQNYSTDIHAFTKGNKNGSLGLVTRVIVCPNPACREFALHASVRTYGPPPGGGHFELGDQLHEWQLVPAAQMKVLPDYVPAPVIADYREACLIRDLSPKASATLARRCLQGMIRDFWGVSKSRLVDEIDAIEEKVDPLTWDGIDAVRRIGNIGAHMERDINVVVDVDPNEAALLIGLIETLIDDWYVNRHERQQRLQKLVNTAAEKDATRKPQAGSG